MIVIMGMFDWIPLRTVNSVLLAAMTARNSLLGDAQAVVLGIMKYMECANLIVQAGTVLG